MIKVHRRPQTVSRTGNPPVFTIKAMMSARPMLSFKLVKRKGSVPAHFPASRSITPKSAPTKGKVDLVDDQQIAAGDAGAALARDLVARRNVDDIDRDIGQFGAEGRGQIVAAALDKYDLKSGKAFGHVIDRGQIDAGILADGGVGQPPVSTPMMRSGTSAPERVRNSASSRV
jgi:hypothetical protein